MKLIVRCLEFDVTFPIKDSNCCSNAAFWYLFDLCWSLST